jgi:chloramphenicol-sensitive protein RarD
MPRDGGPGLPQRRGETGAVLMALAVFAAWGLFPGFFKLLGDVPPTEILAHRILWSAVFMAGLLAVTGRFGQVGRILADRRTLAMLALSAVLIAANWLIYVSAVADGHILEASLGYFISPLTNVALGRLVLGERLSRLQAVACLLAILAVGGFALTVGAAVWRSVALAASFGCYGLVRKTVQAEALPGFAVESFLLAPLALFYLVLRQLQGAAPFDHPPFILALCLSAGVLTALPLLGYAAAARKLQLSTLGLLNYLTPSLQFTLGVAVYGEPFDPKRLALFGVIWLALALYSVEMLRSLRRLPAPN